MTKFVSTILNNPLYILLFGSGGVLVITVAIISIIIQKKSTFDNTINVRKSKKTEIKDNSFQNKSIQVKKSEDTIISGNK